MSKQFFSKVLMTALSVGLLGFALRAGARYLFLDQSYQAAVVAAAAVVRAPIAGHVKDGLGPVGTLYQADMRMLEIEARTVKDDTLHEAEARLAKASAQLEALTSVRPQLDQLEVVLRNSASAYDKRRARQLEAEAAQARALLAAAEARQEANATRLARTETLVAEGLQTRDVLDQARRDKTVTDQELFSSAAAKSAADGVWEAARSGIQVGAFGADKAYSAQRLDEMTLRLADWRTQYVIAEAEVASLKNQVSVERRNLTKRERALLTAPLRGRIWQGYAASNDYVSEGAPLARLASCSVPMVAASVSEKIYDRVSIGRSVVFRVNSTREQIHAVVSQTFGIMTPPAASFDWGLVPIVDVAFGFSANSGTQGVVLLRLDHWPAGFDCQVGITGDVLFDSAPFSHWLW